MIYLGDAFDFSMFVHASSNGPYIVYYLYPHRKSGAEKDPEPLWCVDQPHHDASPSSLSIPIWDGDETSPRERAAYFEARARYLLLWREWIGGWEGDLSKATDGSPR